MLDTFVATLSPMAVMLICIVIGTLVRKFKLAPDNTATVLSRLEVNVFMPALIISSFVKQCTVESIMSDYPLVIYGCIAVGLAILIGTPLSKLFTEDVNERKIYRYSLMIANFGFLGNAVVPQVLGEEGLYSYMLFCIPLNVILYAWAIHSLVPEGKGEKKGILQNLLNPTFISLILGIVLGLTGWGKMLPDFVDTALDKLSGCMAPAAMLLTGFVIGGYDMKELLKNKGVYIATFLRLLILPLVLVGVLWILGANKMHLVLTLFAYGSALGLNTVVIPAAHGGNTHTGAAMAMISHVGAVVTIPLLYALLNWIIK